VIIILFLSHITIILFLPHITIASSSLTGQIILADSYAEPWREIDELAVRCTGNTCLAASGVRSVANIKALFDLSERAKALQK
jgi:hypothetical protein